MSGVVAVTAFLTLPDTVRLFVYRPFPLQRTDPRAWGLEGAKWVEFRAADGSRLAAWWLPPPELHGPVVLLVHGRSANISTRAGIARRLGRDGFGVLLFDFRGYGASEGHPSETGIYEDATAAYQWLIACGVRPADLIVLGQSLGDAPAAHLAATRPVAALALVSPFTSLPDALADRAPWLPIRLLSWPRNRFEVETYVEEVSAPVLLIASRADGLVPFANTSRLAKAARSPIRWIVDDRLRHNGLLAGVSEDGRLTSALRSIKQRPSSTWSASPLGGRRSPLY